jgi:hypothetical protein
METTTMMINGVKKPYDLAQLYRVLYLLLSDALGDDVTVDEQPGRLLLDFDVNPGPELEGGIALFVTDPAVWRRFEQFRKDNPEPPADDREDDDDDDDTISFNVGVD